MSDITTRAAITTQLAERIRETTGIAWEYACDRAEREMRDYPEAARARCEGREMNSDEQRADRARRISARPAARIAALEYLASVGVDVIVAPAKFQRRGFDYWAPSVGQMLTAAQLIEFADRERDLHDGR